MLCITGLFLSRGPKRVALNGEIVGPKLRGGAQRTAPEESQRCRRMSCSHTAKTALARNPNNSRRQVKSHHRSTSDRFENRVCDQERPGRGGAAPNEKSMGGGMMEIQVKGTHCCQGIGGVHYGSVRNEVWHVGSWQSLKSVGSTSVNAR